MCCGFTGSFSLYSAFNNGSLSLRKKNDIAIIASSFIGTLNDNCGYSIALVTN